MEAVKGNAPINGVVEPDFLEYLEKQFKRWQQLAENGVALGSREVAKLTDTIYGARLNARFGFEAVMHRGRRRGAGTFYSSDLQKQGCSSNRKAALFF